MAYPVLGILSAARAGGYASGLYQASLFSVPGSCRHIYMAVTIKKGCPFETAPFLYKSVWI